MNSKNVQKFEKNHEFKKCPRFQIYAQVLKKVHDFENCS